MEYDANFWTTVALIILTAGSEIIGISKLKSNSWLQLIFTTIIEALKFMKKQPESSEPEDDA
jgi:hypothetical protein